MNPDLLHYLRRATEALERIADALEDGPPPEPHLKSVPREAA